MQAYELMSLLSRVKAGTDIRVSINLSPEELLRGEKMDEDIYCLNLDISSVDTEWGSILTRI